jgi:ribosomal protein S18 acetylase RimI-like enzyme
VNFHVRESSSEEDMDFFFKLGYETLKTNRKSIYDKLVVDNPGKSDDEMYEIFRKENEDYFDFNAPTSRVFIAERDDGRRCGYLWMGMRNSEDPWDVQTPLWIYDIVVAIEFRGHGLGIALMLKAEEFAHGLDLNIGLFVHSDNESAIGLYKKTGYVVKIVPISRRLDQSYSVPPVNSQFLIREEQEMDSNLVREAGSQVFSRKVLFSHNTRLGPIKELYEDYVGKYEDDSERNLRLVALTDKDELAGSVWAGVSEFNEKVAMIFELVILKETGTDELGEALVYSAERWAKKSGYVSMYMLLHSEDDMSLEQFRSMGYNIPGFFMEKRLVQ